MNETVSTACAPRKRRTRLPADKEAFTLIEMLIVILIVGIIALIAMPGIHIGTEEAKENTLRQNLRRARNAIELYYVQHNNTYPGASALSRDGGSIIQRAISPQEAHRAFIMQMTLYTTADGAASRERKGDYRFGPYVVPGSQPVNPFTGTSDIICDVTVNDITYRESDGKSAWKYFVRTGMFIANDGEHDDY